MKLKVWSQIETVLSCRAGCGACCIAPSISSLNKLAGVPCLHLDAEFRCRIFGQPERPSCCSGLQPSQEMCGDSRQFALSGYPILRRELARIVKCAFLSWRWLMDPILLLKALILGIVEGLTEFLPISSTGHLILAGDLLNFNDDRGRLFEIVIQSGAILAVVWEYRERLIPIARGAFSDKAAQKFILNLFIAFLPLAILGLAFGKAIKAHLFSPVPVAMSFILALLDLDGQKSGRTSFEFRRLKK